METTRRSASRPAVGTFKIDLSDFPSGVPVDPRLKDAGPTQLQLPALCPPIQASV